LHFCPKDHLELSFDHSTQWLGLKTASNRLYLPVQSPFTFLLSQNFKLKSFQSPQLIPWLLNHCHRSNSRILVIVHILQ
jgi:hypothetical protein